MSPVHEHVVQRTIEADRGHLAQSGFQKRGELGLGHFAGSHGEFPMFDDTLSGHMAIDSNVVGWVGDDHAGFGAGHEVLVGDWVSGITA